MHLCTRAIILHHAQMHKHPCLRGDAKIATSAQLPRASVGRAHLDDRLRRQGVQCGCAESAPHPDAALRSCAMWMHLEDLVQIPEAEILVIVV
jgi:hypothetical protein